MDLAEQQALGVEFKPCYLFYASLDLQAEAHDATLDGCRTRKEMGALTDVSVKQPGQTCPIQHW